MGQVVNIRRYVGDYVYIGRPSCWGNPFEIGKDGDRHTVIQKYEEYIRNNAELMRKIETLRGKKLGCWCKPKECHGDILIKILSEVNPNIE